ncbi:unnamed protein product [Adineta ricciae]|uniref:Rab-GAP TBC domain-containing protein n=1 Tax=Adineta ricciae TaxID=249248 RepID=A0A814DCT1_ADIRI|nr:unnamed protein product [Adineta ricciae]CAF1116275.1 unnamed protein product [Adineta ricciae]
MHVELVSQSEHQHYIRSSSRQIWQRVKNLLKSCIGHRSDQHLFRHDGSLVDRDRLRKKISHHEQSYKQRQKTWPYLLNIYSPTMTDNDKKIYQNQARIRYNKLKRAWQERVSRGDQFYISLADRILKDVRRTDRHMKFFRKNQRILFNIMMTYSVYHPHPGYSQGMSDMLTPIVYVFLDESMSYFAYCSLMTRYMSSLFDRNQIEINHRLYRFDLIFRSIDYELWSQINLNNDQDDNSLFVYRWLLLDCKREFHHRFSDVLRVLELIWVNSMSLTVTETDRSLFTIFVCISLLEEDRNRILSCSTEDDLHEYFYSSSTSISRSRCSTKRILQRAQNYHASYTSVDKK